MSPSRAIRSAFVACIVLFALTTRPGASCFANGPEVRFDAGLAFPVASTDISLVSEHVTIRAPLEGGIDGRMECSYLLRNPLAHPIALPMAFVVPTGNPPHSGGFPAPTDDPMLDLRVHARHGDLAVRRSAVDPGAWKGLINDVPDSLPTWTVPLAAAGTTDLYISSRAGWWAEEDSTHVRRSITYSTRPARLWKGPVGSAEIVILLGEATTALLRGAPAGGPGPRVHIAPAGYEWMNQGVRWRFRNWEPAQDCVIAIEYDLVGPYDIDR